VKFPIESLEVENKALHLNDQELFMRDFESRIGRLHRKFLHVRISIFKSAKSAHTKKWRRRNTVPLPIIDKRQNCRSDRKQAYSKNLWIASPTIRTDPHSAPWFPSPARSLPPCAVLGERSGGGSGNLGRSGRHRGGRKRGRGTEGGRRGRVGDGLLVFPPLRWLCGGRWGWRPLSPAAPLNPTSFSGRHVMAVGRDVFVADLRIKPCERFVFHP
jgi:hypothetical protein